jgi:hypothetical protein
VVLRSTCEHADFSFLKYRLQSALDTPFWTCQVKKHRTLGLVMGQIPEQLRPKVPRLVGDARRLVPQNVFSTLTLPGLFFCPPSSVWRHCVCVCGWGWNSGP